MDEYGQQVKWWIFDTYGWTLRFIHKCFISPFKALLGTESLLVLLLAMALWSPWVFSVPGTSFERPVKAIIQFWVCESTTTLVSTRWWFVSTWFREWYVVIIKTTPSFIWKTMPDGQQWLVSTASDDTVVTYCDRPIFKSSVEKKTYSLGNRCALRSTTTALLLSNPASQGVLRHIFCVDFIRPYRWLPLWTGLCYERCRRDTVIDVSSW